jgi:hypothetical protein
MMKKNEKLDLKTLVGGPAYYSKPATYIHSFYLYAVGSPEEYTDWFDVIRNCSENDIIKIHINSPGGNLLTTIQLMRALAECQGTIICSVEGECMSAATMIFLQADMVEVSDHSMFMFHNYSGGTFGKGGEMMDQLKYESVWSENLLRSVYQDFLSEEEIDMMLNNKDLWMNGEEVTERVRQKAEKLQMKLAEEEEAEQPDLFED